MLRDILKGDAQVEAVAKIIALANADILVLQDIDFDAKWHGLRALNQKLASEGAGYDYLFTAQPNVGVPTGLDLDQDGRLSEPEDNQSYGAFPGQGGIAILSRFEIQSDETVDYTKTLWADVEQNMQLGVPFGDILPEGAARILRLSSRTHLKIPIRVGDTTIELLTHYATTPVFDGPEDRNGWRNAAENRFWETHLDADKHQILVANTNLDPDKGEGRREIMQDILFDPRLQDPFQGQGDAETVVWQSTGPMRVSYVLPSLQFRVVATGRVYSEDPTHPAQIASRHRLIWVDLELP